MIEHYTYASPKKGPHVLFFGAVHGNEVCGPKGIRKYMALLKAGRIALSRGSITFVPVCNPRAYEAGIRQTEENLNRVFIPTKKPRSYEARLANELCPLIDQSDILVDLHSISSEGKPFVFLDRKTPDTEKLATSLQLPFTITGWTELYESLGSTERTDDTVSYALSKGKTALTVECGTHTSPASVVVAFKTIEKTLGAYGMLHTSRSSKRSSHAIEVCMTRVFFRQEGEKLARKFKHLDRVRAGARLITRADGTALVAEHDGYVVMPTPLASIGEDWLYIGTAKPPHIQ